MLPDARLPSHGGNPGSNPGSGIHRSPANAGLFPFFLVQSRTNSAKAGPREVVARPDTDAGRTVWHRWDDRAMAEPTKSHSTLGAGCELEAIAA